MDLTSERKMNHLEICRDREVGSREKSTHLNDVELIHKALPELNFEDVDLSVEVFGKVLSVPIIISAMTGGHPETKKVNENLARAAGDLRIGMCVGSQRAALENPKLEDSFSVVRKISNDIFVMANMGAAQLLSSKAVNLAERAIEMIDADALAVHLNPLQELVQPGGDTQYKGVIKSLSTIVASIKKPIIVKETGCGISREVAKKLLGTGVSAIDVAGAGGTSWAAVEYHNATLQGDTIKAGIAETFWDWGIPTAMSLCEVSSLGSNVKIIASGGIRNGLDMARSIALGADLVGVARPLLISAFEGPKAIEAKLNRMIYELKVASLLTGSRTLKELKVAPIILKAELLNWVTKRGLGVKNDARG
jgi:isopentenyl-diphosphate delta-isomerase